MTTRNFADLVRDLRTRRTVGDRPPVLLLGAGASVDAGIGAMPELIKFFDCDSFESFLTAIDTVSSAERYRYLAQFLQTRSPDTVTPGYQALATLCAQNYFDLVLTTNMDPLLDDALAAARLWRRDYLLLVNGIVRPDRLKTLLLGQSPRVKVLKLHGDLFQRYMAWTLDEMDSFVGEVAGPLAAAVDGRDFLVVGYSLRDARVRQLVEAASGAVWFTHPLATPAHLLAAGGTPLAGLRSVVAPECSFERIFPALLAALGPATAAPPAAAPRGRSASAVQPPSAPAQPAAQSVHADAAATSALQSTADKPQARTIDDLTAAVLALVNDQGVAGATAFLLESPRVIVCDKFGAFGRTKRKSLVIESNGERYDARVLHVGSHAFGPLVLEVPPALRARGLALAQAPAVATQAVHVAVQAGARQGLSDGVVRGAVGPVVIAPIPKPVAGLVELQCVVAPGSSGAPVVDDGSMAVIGFIVAGSSDPDNPRSFMFPASAWVQGLVEIGK